MLRLLFQSLEQSLGPFLSQAALLIYWSGLILVACAALVPVYRVFMDRATVRLGLEQHWLMTCGHCGQRTIVTGRRCGSCDRDLGIPWTVRRWTASFRRCDTKWARRLRWIGHLLGSAGFVLLSIWIVTATGALAPQGELHRLFLGVALLAWAAVGWLGGRALRLGSGTLFHRVRDVLIALAALGVMAMALFLADAARPIPEERLAHFSVEGSLAHIGGRVIFLPEEEIGFEYLQLDHDLLGYHRVVPMAFVGTTRLPVSRSALGQWIINHLRTYADTYTARGLTVRLRTDRLRVGPGHSYEIVRRKGQVLIRRVKDTSP